MDELNCKKGPFVPDMESLRNYVCPDWFRDAKFGIWSHWGPQSVPMYGDWYARNMYMEGSEQYRYHCRKYGHPSQFGYKDIIPLWKAERFEPDALMELYVSAGARYFVAQAVHHDNFYNYHTELSKWNCVNMGPGKDICQMWKAAAKKHGLPFGVSEHLGASYTWFQTSHGCDKRGPYSGVFYDGADPENESLYRDNDSENLDTTWYTKNKRYHPDWYRRIREVIDQLQPDLLYSDGDLPFGTYGEHIVAHLYNTSASLHEGHNQAVYTQKDINPEVYRIGVLDIERGIHDEIMNEPWQDDTSIGDWYYNVRDQYKTAEDIIHTLVDVVSKNGNLLVNVTQKPDGTIDDESRYTLHRIGEWMGLNGEGIYGTRPYKQYSEGKTQLPSGAFKENTADWTEHDFRFTQKNDTVYVFQMKSSDHEAAQITCLGRIYEREIKAVYVQGTAVEFQQKDGALLVSVPQNPMPSFPVCIKVELMV